MPQMAIQFPGRGQDGLAVSLFSRFGHPVMLRGILNWWEETRLRVKLLLAFGIYLVLMAFLVWGYLLRNAGEPEPEAGTEFTEPAVPATAEGPGMPDPLGEFRLDPAERRILEEHLKAIGGVDRLASIKSILAHGTATYEDGSKLNIVVAKKQGDKMRLTMKMPKGQVVNVISPEDSWQAAYQAGVLLMVEDLADADFRRMKRSSYLVSELYLATLNSWQIRYIGEQAFNYEMAHCFEVKLSERELIRFFIDPETMLDVGREEWLFDGDGTLTIQRMVGTGHVDINGLMVPGRIESYENNVLKQTFVLTDMEVNPGLLDGSFERPRPPQAIR